MRVIIVLDEDAVFDREHETKYVTVGPAGELEVSDENGVWLITYAPGCWRRVRRDA
jgi:hypothetical protein